MANNKPKKPVMDSGEPYRERPFTVGGKDQGDLSARKNALLGTGTVGHVPGNPYTQQAAGHVHVAQTQHDAYDDLEPAPRPMPREIPVHSMPTHTGTITRYLDGHSEVHRERPGLVELMKSPHVHPDDREDIRQEIAHRDAIHNHVYW